MENLQIKHRNTIEELEGQRNICRATLRRAVEAENQLKEMKERCSSLEAELLTSDVERDQLREDRRKVRGCFSLEIDTATGLNRSPDHIE